jgi:hypothetical protein
MKIASNWKCLTNSSGGGLRASLQLAKKAPGKWRVVTQAWQDMMNSNSPHRTDDPLASEKILVDRKVFFLDLKENQRGRFLKITEDVSGRRDTIMLPASAFQEFTEALARIMDIEQRL